MPVIKTIFKYQIRQLAAFIALSILVGFLYKILNIPQGQFLGLKTEQWFWMSIILPFIHQIYVFICWRAELYYKGITKLFGQNAFKYYTGLFIIILLLRPIGFIALGISDWESLEMNFLLRTVIACMIIVPALYTFYSIHKYFGVFRATGEDHFMPEIYREKTFVKKGVFKYCSNSMYTFAALIFWALGIFCASKAVLLSAFFSHIFIWVHYFCTEKPDMDYIYKK